MIFETKTKFKENYFQFEKYTISNFCLACEAEARHMYYFSGVVVVVVVVGGGVNFLVLRPFFSDTIRARAMKLGSCIHLEELRSTLCSIFET